MVDKVEMLIPLLMLPFLAVFILMLPVFILAYVCEFGCAGLGVQHGEHDLPMAAEPLPQEIV